MQKFIIEKFTPDDIYQIEQLFYETVHAINARDYSQEQLDVWAPGHRDPHRWLEKLSDTIAHVAKYDCQIIGFANTTYTGYIDHLYVHKDFQGKGVATALLKKLEDELRLLSITTLRTEASITAKLFFEKHGYVVVKKQEKKHGGLLFTNYLMEKTI